MSVPKSRRGESPAEYINLAREIYVFTYNRVRILPKSYTFYFSLPLYNAARGFSFVKVRFRYGRNGKIIRKATYQGIRHMMDKLKIFRRWTDLGRMTAADVAASVTSWLGHMKKFHSYFAVQRVLRLYGQLFLGGTYGIHHLQAI